MAQRIIKAGVVGAGVFGGHHARKYARTDGVRLVAVHDPDGARAAALAIETGSAALTLEALLDTVDVVTVVSPAVTHAAMARAALLAGRSVYVEKPLATALDDADRLITLAAKAGLTLACGHQERAVFAAMGLIGLPERPLRIEAVRRGGRSGRGEDVSVVLDLMTHDIDLALMLSGADAIAVEAEGDADTLAAEVTFSDGLTAVFEASRAAPSRERTMQLIFPSGEVEVDFLARTFRNTTPFTLDPAFADTHAGRDPLGASVDAFLAAVRGEAIRPLVTGEEALAALDLALAVEQAAGL